MSGGHELTEQVYAAKTDSEAADALIRQYMGFIRAEAAKFLHRAPVEGQDEEFSIVLLASMRLFSDTKSTGAHFSPMLRAGSGAG